MAPSRRREVGAGAQRAGHRSQSVPPREKRSGQHAALGSDPRGTGFERLAWGWYPTRHHRGEEGRAGALTCPRPRSPERSRPPELFSLVTATFRRADGISHPNCPCGPYPERVAASRSSVYPEDGVLMRTPQEPRRAPVCQVPRFGSRGSGSPASSRLQPAWRSRARSPTTRLDSLGGCHRLAKIEEL